MTTSLRTIAASAIAIFALAACNDDPTSPSGPTSAHGVTAAFIFPGSCNNLCEPLPGSDTKLTSIHITNTSSATVYVQQCGDAPRIIQESYNGDTWVTDGPSVVCPVQTSFLTLAPGASLDSWRFLANGQYRVHISIATSAAETDFEVAMSNTITVK